jgi:hypothetical protein
MRPNWILEEDSDGDLICEVDDRPEGLATKKSGNEYFETPPAE